jgi:RNA polymerase sigma-70 factor (ECF subfamily)
MFASVPPTTTLAGEQADEMSQLGADVDRALDVFLAERTRLLCIARRVTGDVGSAEDVVQEAWLRWQRADRRGIDNAAAFLTTTTTHLAINVIQSARCRHEAPAETPLAAFDETEDPTRLVEQTSAVEETLLLLMAKLRPSELTAYLLRKGFDYPYGQIAALMRTSSANARQLVRRAQQRLDGGRMREVAPEAHRELVAAFVAAARHGDLAGLERLLAQGMSRCPRQRPVRRALPSPRPSTRIRAA